MYDVGQSSLFSILHKTANNLNGTINADPLGKRHGQRTKTFKTYTHVVENRLNHLIGWTIWSRKV